MPTPVMSSLGRVSTTNGVQRSYSPFSRSSDAGAGSRQCLEVGCSTLSGNRYGSLNQDYGCVQEMYTPAEIPNEGKQVYIMAICDGHGILGEKAAVSGGKAMVRAIFSGAFRNKNLSKMPLEDLETEMKAVFHKGHAAAIAVYDNAPKTIDMPKPSGATTTYTLTDVNGVSTYRCNGKGPEKMLEFGSTATVAVVQGHRLCVANVGDSQAVLGSCDDEGECSAEVVTAHHWGRNAEEAARIREQFGPGVKLLEDGYLRVVAGPWSGYELAVTRALGHKNIQHHGVTCEPYVVTKDLQPHHFCLVLASDGIWDVMSPRDVVLHVLDSAREQRTAQQAAAALVQHAVDLGLGGPGGEQDNTSAVVMYL